MKHMRLSSVFLLCAAMGLAGPSFFAAQPQQSDPGEQLEAIPEPNLDALEEAVAAQLREVREVLLSALEQPGATAQERGQAFGELGRVYHAYELESPAAACYANAASLDRGDFRWSYLLGYLRQKAGRLDDARRLYERALAAGNSYVPALIRLGSTYLELNLVEQAAAVLTEALRLDPSSAAAMAALGQVHLSRRSFAEAIALLEQALATIPEADRLHYPLGLAYRGQGNMDKAREHLALRGTVGVRPADPIVDELPGLTRGETVHVLRGQMAYRAKRFDEAALEFRKAVAANPNSSGARVNLGSTLVQIGDEPGALLQFRQALSLAPNDATARFNLGSLLLHRGKLEAAAEHLEAAIRLTPDDAQAHVGLADCRRRLGRTEEALSLYFKATGLDPNIDAAWLGNAEMLIVLGRYTEALERLENAQALLPHSGQVTHAIARLLAGSPDATMRDGARSLPLALRVFEARSSISHAETVAMSLAEVGRCEEAAEWQRQAVTGADTQGDGARAAELRRILEIYAGEPPCRYPVEAPDTMAPIH